jgi:transposase-like protein
MNAENRYPKTLMEAVLFFSDLDLAQTHFVQVRWPDGVTCPHCGSKEVSYLANQRRWKCKNKHPKQQFSAKAGTIFEDSPLGLDKWLVAVWLEVNAKNSVSSYELHRALGVTQKSAWFMLHRVRLALKSGSFEKFGQDGTPVEADETYIGGLAKNMHLSRRRKTIKGTGGAGKSVVMGLLERGKDGRKSRVHTAVVPDASRPSLHPVIYKTVEKGAKVFTDDHKPYRSIGPDYTHAFVNHFMRYVDGEVHTNGLENFWNLFKRCVKGTHVSIDPAHLAAYLDSEMFRFNNRGVKDADRFRLALGGATGRRLTYAALTGASEGVS